VELRFAAAIALSTLTDEIERFVELVVCVVIWVLALLRAASMLAEEVAMLVLSFWLVVIAAF
jgi:hypothetical protein